MFTRASSSAGISCDGVKEMRSGFHWPEERFGMAKAINAYTAFKKNQNWKIRPKKEFVNTNR